MTLLSLFCMTCLITSGVVNAGPAKGSEAEKSIEYLSNELRKLLQDEMKAIESAMKEIVSANANGDMKKIATLAGKMEDSFILKKKLTKKQKHELHSKLPDDFIQRDTGFHYFASMLEHVAENNKVELIGFYYSKLLESCSGCHAEYAKHKFPMFDKNVKTHEHHH